MIMPIPKSCPFLSHLAEIKELLRPRLHHIVQNATPHERLRQAMMHGVQGSGKFIRPFLTLTFAHCAGGKEWTPAVMDTAIAIELFHSYSLIHDDLPSMDDADLRRGLPSCWKAFDEATAILAGDALIPLAYELLATLETSADNRLALITEFSKAAGAKGMVAGQMMDLYPSAHLHDIRQMQLLKTGALLSFSCMAGIILGDSAHSPLLSPARQFGLNLGLIYQITDDLLSEQGTANSTGKPVQNDQNKITFISVLGLKTATELLRQLVAETHAIAVTFDRNEPLHELLDFMAVRTF
jgi:geranylgeranyl pyrophosphate synthase